MRRRAALSLAAVCLLSACAHQAPPAAMPGMAWSLNNVEGEGAKLAFGAPNSDNVALMLVCQPGSGRIEVHGPELGSTSTVNAGDPSVSALARTGEARFGKIRPPAAPKDKAAQFVASCRG
jgi:hypothetical protein